MKSAPSRGLLEHFFMLSIGSGDFSGRVPSGKRYLACATGAPSDVANGPNPEELSLSKYLPGYPRKRTSLDTVGMSQKCQYWKSIDLHPGFRSAGHLGSCPCPALIVAALLKWPALGVRFRVDGTKQT